MNCLKMVMKIWQQQMACSYSLTQQQQTKATWIYSPSKQQQQILTALLLGGRLPWRGSAAAALSAAAAAVQQQSWRMQGDT
jgi:hypothetical protein